MMMNDVTSLYFRPDPQRLRHPGRHPLERIQPRHHSRQVAATPGAQAPRCRGITNSTYDGLFYNTGFIKGAGHPYIHFDTVPCGPTPTSARSMKARHERRRHAG